MTPKPTPCSSARTPRRCSLHSRRALWRPLRGCAAGVHRGHRKARIGLRNRRARGPAPRDPFFGIEPQGPPPCLCVLAHRYARSGRIHLPAAPEFAPADEAQPVAGTRASNRATLLIFEVQQVTTMARSPATSALDTEFDAFLYEQVRTDAGAVPASVLSILARLDLDPWQEAAQLATMPEQLAMQRLIWLFAGLPGDLVYTP